jgi:hypothetical protein
VEDGGLARGVDRLHNALVPGKDIFCQRLMREARS